MALGYNGPGGPVPSLLPRFSTSSHIEAFDGADGYGSASLFELFRATVLNVHQMRVDPIYLRSQGGRWRWRAWPCLPQPSRSRGHRI